MGEHLRLGRGQIVGEVVRPRRPRERRDHARHQIVDMHPAEHLAGEEHARCPCRHPLQRRSLGPVDAGQAKDMGIGKCAPAEIRVDPAAPPSA